MNKANELIARVIEAVRAQETLHSWVGDEGTERRWRALQLATAKQELTQHISGLQSQLDEAANHVDDLESQIEAAEKELDDRPFCNDPSPWCSYGHKTEAACDCGPIAENE